MIFERAFGVRGMSVADINANMGMISNWYPDAREVWLDVKRNIIRVEEVV